MKNGQFIGQIFIYVLAIIITAIILGYGYKAIVTFKDKTEQVSYIQFKTDLQNSIESITSDFGSVKISDLSLPTSFKKVCFVKTYPTDIPEQINEADYPIISDSTSSDVEKNVFLVENIAKDSFYVGKIDVNEDSEYLVNDNLLCIDVISGKIKLRLEGRGDHTKIDGLSLG